MGKEVGKEEVMAEEDLEEATVVELEVEGLVSVGEDSAMVEEEEETEVSKVVEDWEAEVVWVVGYEVVVEEG